MPLNSDQQIFYQSHINLATIGETKQQLLNSSKVLLVGAGGLGNHIALLLGMSGVQLTIIDGDTVATSNLIRQLAFSLSDVGKNKAQVLADAIMARNNNTKVTTIPKFADEKLLTKLLIADDYAVVIDATDNREAKIAISKSCSLHKNIWISGNALGTSGNVIAFNPNMSNAPCYGCLYPHNTSSNNACSTYGVLNSLVSTIASLQSMEAIKVMLNAPINYHQLFSFDAMTLISYNMQINHSANCNVCN